MFCIPALGEDHVFLCISSCSFVSSTFYIVIIDVKLQEKYGKAALEVDALNIDLAHTVSQEEERSLIRSLVPKGNPATVDGQHACYNSYTVVSSVNNKYYTRKLISLFNISKYKN